MAVQLIDATVHHQWRRLTSYLTGVVHFLDGLHDTTSLSALLNLWYDLSPDSHWQPYLGAGAGFTRSKTELSVGGTQSVNGSDNTFSYQAGAGLGYRINPKLIVSLDYRYLSAGSPQYDSIVRPVTSEYTAHTLTVGLRYRLTPIPPPDSDGDGVIDPKDPCPDTPRGETVDADGCPPPPPALPEPAPMPEPQPEPIPPPVVAPIPAPLSEPPPAPVPPEVPATISFELNSAKLTAEAEQALEVVAKNMAAAPLFNLVVAGHASDEGSDRYNLKLSAARAATVKDFLTNRGIDANRIQTEAFGETRPVVPNTDDSSRNLNRRVELKVPELRSTPIELPVPPAVSEPPPPTLQPAEPAPDLQPV